MNLALIIEIYFHFKYMAFDLIVLGYTSKFHKLQLIHVKNLICNSHKVVR